MNRPDRHARAVAAGTVRGHQERIEALARFNRTPHHCQNPSCLKMIEVGDRRVADVIKKRYCSYSCASTHRHALRRLTNNQSPA